MMGITSSGNSMACNATMDSMNKDDYDCKNEDDDGGA